MIAIQIQTKQGGGAGWSAIVGYPERRPAPSDGHPRTASVCELAPLDWENRIRQEKCATFPNECYSTGTNIDIVITNGMYH